MKPAIVVSGHPRTGTSMTMRMLHLGGLTIVADPDSIGENWEKYANKYGCFEVLPKNHQWILDNPRKLSGNGIKIVTQDINILESLARDGLPLRVIFMLRPLQAIHKSLKNIGIAWDPLPVDSIALGLKVLDKYKIPHIFIQYEEALKNPKIEAMKIKDFVESNLDVDLDLEKMVSAVDPAECHYH